jgi:hypothetical protein
MRAGHCAERERSRPHVENPQNNHSPKQGLLEPDSIVNSFLGLNISGSGFGVGAFPCGAAGTEAVEFSAILGQRRRSLAADRSTNRVRGVGASILTELLSQIVSAEFSRAPRRPLNSPYGATAGLARLPVACQHIAFQ